MSANAKLPKPPPNKPVTTLKNIPRELREQMTPKGIDGQALPPPPANPSKTLVSAGGSVTIKRAEWLPGHNIPLGAQIPRPDKWLRNAVDDATAFARPGASSARALRGMSPYATPRVLAELAQMEDKKRGIIGMFPEGGRTDRVLSKGPLHKYIPQVKAEIAAHQARRSAVRSRKLLALLGGGLGAAAIARMLTRRKRDEFAEFAENEG